MCFAPIVQPASESITPPPPQPDPQPSLAAAQSLALAALTAILKDPEAPVKERRLAAVAILRHVAAMRPRSRSSTPRASASRRHAEPPSNSVTSSLNHSVTLDRLRNAYDNGYWAGFHRCAHTPEGPFYPAAPADGRENINFEPSPAQPDLATQQPHSPAPSALESAPPVPP